MANFSPYFPKLLIYEGGWVNDPYDNGGCTNMGITLAALKIFRGKSATCQDIKNLSKQETEAIYKKNYWDKIKGDQINSQSLAELLFDYSVHSGIKKASQEIQEIVGVPTDGIIGPKTVEAINSKDAKTVFEELKQNRKDYFNSIVRNNPSQSKFLKGWMNRINSFTFKS